MRRLWQQPAVALNERSNGHRQQPGQQHKCPVRNHLGALLVGWNEYEAAVRERRKRGPRGRAEETRHPAVCMWRRQDWEGAGAAAAAWGGGSYYK